MKTLLVIIVIAAGLAATAIAQPALSNPVQTSGAPSVSYYALAVRYSPVVVQDVGCPCLDWPESLFCFIPLMYGDYITRIDYDGNYVGNDNWDHLGWPDKTYPLRAYVYYAVMETLTHYFIWYALFHPADDFHCHECWHENDLEGMVMCVLKDGSTYGQLRLVQLQAHNDFYQYKAPGATGIENGEDGDTDSIDGTIQVVQDTHPVVYVEGGGHGIRDEKKWTWYWPTSWPSVIYFYKGEAEDPDDVADRDVNGRQVGYDLLSISAEMWERRRDYYGSGCLFDDKGDYEGSRYRRSGNEDYLVRDIGRKFDGDEYDPWCSLFGGGAPDAASPPWTWDDDDDSGAWLGGDWFMDPALYHEERLKWAEQFSTEYIFHPFLYEHLGGDIYNGKGGTTTLRCGPYRVVFDVRILPAQTLTISPGRTILFNHNARITSQGKLEADGSSETIRLVQTDNPDKGMKLNGRMRLQNGGCIRFP